VTDQRVFMKIRGPLVDMLLEQLAPKIYSKFGVYKGKSNVLQIRVLMAIYEILLSTLLFYRKLRKDLEQIGFEANPYDPCVANRMISSKQHGNKARG